MNLSFEISLIHKVGSTAAYERQAGEKLRQQ